MGTKLFIGSLPWKTTEDALRAYFSEAGEVASVRIINDRETGRSKGFGFVEYANGDDAAKAVEMFNGKEFEGRNIFVSEARPERPRE